MNGKRFTTKATKRQSTEEERVPFVAICDFVNFVLMPGHIFNIGLASQAKLKKQKNGWQKNGGQPASGLHFSARHFSAASVRVPCFYKCVLRSGILW
jgi:hypothetical protein